MKKKPKILFIVSELGIGGAQKRIVEIANAMVERGFDAVLLNLGIREDEDILKDISPEIPVRKPESFSKLSKRGFPAVFSSVYALYETVRTVRREKADIVCARQWSAKFPAFFAGLIMGMKNRTVLIEASNSEYEIGRKRHSGLSKKIIFSARKAALNFAGAVVANSRGLARKTGSYFGLKREIVIIKNGADSEHVREKSLETANHPYFRENTPVAVSVGRVDPQKGFFSLIEAISAVNRKTPLRLIIVGGGEIADSLKRHAENIGMGKNVSITGSEANPHKYTARCDVFVCSSIYEGFSGALLEAAALGMPIVSTDHPFGANEVIEDGKNGLLVPVGDTEAMAEAVLKLLENKTFSRNLGEAAKKRAGDFQIEKMFSAYEKLFRNISSDGRGCGFSENSKGF